MPKRLIQDIVPKKKPLAANLTKKETHAETSGKENSFFSSLTHEKEKKSLNDIISEGKIGKKYKIKINNKFVLTGILLAILVIGSIFALSKFSSIRVEITPRQEIIEINATFDALIEPKNGILPLEVMQLTKEESGSIKPTGTKEVSKKASGQIIIYNAYNSDSQPLVKSTRFMSSDGKIYRIDNSIVVPGISVVEGKIVAGEIETTIYADKPGEEYNIGLVDFTIPGFKDSPKYEKIYARSKTEMKNGFIGQMPVVAEKDINDLRSSLKEKITEYLLGMSSNPKPDEFLLYGAAKQITFRQEEAPKTGTESDLLQVSETGTLYGFLLKKSDISRVLAEKYLPEIAPKVELMNADKLEFELKKFTPAGITFNLKGSAVFFWKIDENELKKGIISERENPNLVFAKYSAIEKAKIIFKPNWWRFIPKDTSRIDIF